MSGERLITLPELQEALRRLAAKLSEQGVVGEIYVLGGAAMVLAYNAREATRDVDALFEPRELVHSAAVEVAESLALLDGGSTTTQRATSRVKETMALQCWPTIDA